MRRTTHNMTGNTAVNDVITVTSNGTLVLYKSDEYVNKVFRYFVLKLIKENDSHNLLTDEKMFNLININANINEENINEQPKSIQNLYEDVMKLKNNYLFAYYLSRLTEYHNTSNNDYSSNKYFKYYKYITGLNKDIETINWNVSMKTVRNTLHLQGIYGYKMHSLTKEFIRKGYVSKVTAYENIDDVIKLYITNIKTMICNIKISKLIQIKEDLDNLSRFNLKDNCNDDYEDDLLEENDFEYDQIHEWYYGNDSDEIDESYYEGDKNKKRKFEELVLSIIYKYEMNKKIKIEDKRREEGYKRVTFFDKIIDGVLCFTVTYCIVSYLIMNFEYFSGDNSNNYGVR